MTDHIFNQGPERAIPITGYGIPEGTVAKVSDAVYDQAGQEQEDESMNAPQESHAGHEQQGRTFDTPPTFHTTVEVRQPRLWPRRLLATAVALGALGGAVNYISDHMPKVPQVLPEAQHDLEVSIEDVKTEVVYDKSIKFAEVISTFDYFELNSLDRWGPSNCDASIEGTVTTRADAEITVSEAAITRKGNKATIEVTGNITTDSDVSVDGGLPDATIASGGLDACNGDNELDWAERIAYGQKANKKKEQEAEDGVLKNAGEIATACAIEQEGEKALTEAIKHNAMVFSDILDGVNAKNITVTYKDNFADQAEAERNKAIATFYKDFDAVAKEYLDETDDHTEPKLNARELVDCKEHKIIVDRNG